MEGLGIEISWPSRKPREKPSRVHNHHVSLRDRIKELKHHHHHPPKAGDGGDKEATAKAVAWAVFQHHGEGSGPNHGHTHGIAVRRPTRFKIEAQMRHELAHRSVCEAAAVKWDAGSSLFDSFELHSLLKTLDDAAHAPTAPQKSHGDGEDAGALVVCTPPKSPTHWTSDEKPRAHREAQQRYNLTAKVKHGREHQQEDASSVIFGQFHIRRSFDSASEKPAAKEVGDSQHQHHHHHHSKWKNLLHTLHLDGAHGLFHKSHTQVAPHDLEQKSRLRQKDGSQELYDGHFERNELPVSMDVNPPAEKEHDHHHHHHHPHFWKLGFKPFCRAGHATLSDSEGSDCEDAHPKKKYHGHRQTDLRKAWSSLRANLLHHHHHHHRDSPAVIEHHHHHHHYHEEQAISRRLSRDEKVRRVSSEEGGLKTPRNSLETVVVSVCT